jgi:CRISPR-associated exonuclease Cas4
MVNTETATKNYSLDQPVTGVLFQSYGICKRQVWLMAHKIVPDQENQFIELGRLLDENSYQRERKKIVLDNIEIDVIAKKEKRILIGEIKKSSRALESATLQLCFYLFELKQSGIHAQGVLMFPTEKRRIPVELTLDREIQITQIKKNIETLIHQVYPPDQEYIKYCSKCAYEEFCWS